MPKRLPRTDNPALFDEPDFPTFPPSPPPRISPLVPSPVYDTYWRFAAERQNIFFRRLEGGSAPWTEDPVLLVHKFTNAYRASDRVSQFLIRRVIYRDDLPQDVDEVVFRILLFKFFNRIETWELLENQIGPLTYRTFSFKAFDKILSKEMARGNTIYSAAYIMPSSGSLGYDRKHRNHLTLIERMMSDNVPKRLSDLSRMQDAFELIRSYPSIGDFLAYQYVTDINYSEVTDFKETEFVVPGPGSIDGIRKCFLDTGGLSNAEIIRFMADRQKLEFERLGLKFRNLWGRDLQYMDCQNLFCEVDKYSRVRHPEISGVSGRTRIKQKFKPKAARIDYWYPPKWNINTACTATNRPVEATTAEVASREKDMDFQTYQERANRTDRNPERSDNGIMIPLLGLAGEAGGVLAEYKKYLRDGKSHTQFRDRFIEELGDVLWYLASIATKFDVNLSEVAEKNLRKCEERWVAPPVRPAFDLGYPDKERFPRRFMIDFATTHDKDEKPIVRAFYKGEAFGDSLTDNAEVADGYAFHDAIHLSFAAVLGWSPLTRKLLKAKRRSNPKVDEVQDGARAVYTEEGLSTLIFTYAREYNWLEGKASLSSELLRSLRKSTEHLEVACCTEWEWESAIVQAFAVWREIRKRGSGTVVLNLDDRSLALKD